jgi:hypothetical protein
MIEMVEERPDGTTWMSKSFVVRGGQLAVGNGAVGYRRGRVAVVCAQADLLTLADDGTCLNWSDFTGAWESSPRTCVWSQQNGKDVLTVGTDEWRSVLIASGDVLTSDQFDREASAWTRASDYDAAKAWVIGELTRDWGAIARAAGGKVGDTTTVAGLHATYAADPSWKGKQVSITARVLMAGPGTATTGARTLVILVDSDDRVDPPVRCNTTDADLPALGARVKATGTLGELFGAPVLDSCTIVTSE